MWQDMKRGTLTGEPTCWAKSRAWNVKSIPKPGILRLYLQVAACCGIKPTIKPNCVQIKSNQIIHNHFIYSNHRKHPVLHGLHSVSFGPALICAHGRPGLWPGADYWWFWRGVNFVDDFDDSIGFLDDPHTYPHMATSLLVKSAKS